MICGKPTGTTTAVLRANGASHVIHGACTTVVDP
jgi:hypothetical protein